VTPASHERDGRLIALLGGTTSWGDAMGAMRHLLWPNSLVEGSSLPAYEEAFAQRVGRRWGFGFLAGRVGLYGILRALGVGTGDEVLLQVPTHVVVANAIRYVGARPVFVDCDLRTFNLDLDEAERLVTPRTRAIVVQHTFGVPVDMDRVDALARRHGIAVVEDCVHALGATYHGRPVGSFGQASFFSTEETKTISTTMGGVALTDDPELADRLRSFQAECSDPPASLVARYVLKLAAYHVLTEPHLHRLTRAAYEALGRRNPLPGPTVAAERAGRRPAGYARRLGNAQAALGLRQLRRLDGNVAHRRRISQIYRSALADAGVAGIRAPDDAEPAFVRYPVWVADRGVAVDRLRPRAVAGTWFNSVLGESADPAVVGYEGGSCPRAEAAARHLVNLPTHGRVTADDAERLVELVRPLAEDPSIA
jgi:dTDP-4-amino-4,6-dideoxygalactose transaminase